MQEKFKNVIKQIQNSTLFDEIQTSTIIAYLTHFRVISHPFQQEAQLLL